MRLLSCSLVFVFARSAAFRRRCGLLRLLWLGEWNDLSQRTSAESVKCALGWRSTLLGRRLHAAPHMRRRLAASELTRTRPLIRSCALSFDSSHTLSKA